jgi:hypothetical protein
MIALNQIPIPQHARPLNQGVIPMKNMLATMLQPDLSQAAKPSYADNASIWHHMSEALHQSFYRVLSLLFSILPGILALIVALVVLTLVGMALSALLRRLLTAARFDERIANGQGSNNWTPSTSPTALIARASFWGCVLLGFIIGILAFDASYPTAASLTNSLLPYMTRVLGAVFLLIAGTLFARFIARSVLIEAVNVQLEYARFLSLGIKWLVLVLTAAMVLDHLQIGGNVVELAFGILFGGIVLTLSLAVGLGSRDLVSRSLESYKDHPSERAVATPTVASTSDSIRHF